MKMIAGWVTVCLVAVVVLAAGSWAVKTVEMNSPHFKALARENCTVCHDVDDLKSILGDDFITAILEPCYRCHSHDNLGRTHPVNVDLKRNFTMPDMVVPDEMFVGGQWDDLLTCATCHEVHGEWKSTIKSSGPGQKPIYNLAVSGRYYSTFFLRIPGDPDQGWAVLCDTCHAGYL